MTSSSSSNSSNDSNSSNSKKSVLGRERERKKTVECQQEEEIKCVKLKRGEERGERRLGKNRGENNHVVAAVACLQIWID